MKKSIILLVIAAIILGFSSCRQTKYITDTEYVHDTLVVNKIQDRRIHDTSNVYVKDSVWMNQYKDSLGRLVVEHNKIHIERQKVSQASQELLRNDSIRVNTVYKNVNHYKTIKENYVTKSQKAWIKLGKMFLIVISLGIVFLVVKYRKNLLNLVRKLAKFLRF